MRIPAQPFRMVLTIFAPLNIAGEGKEIAAIMAIPVLLLWLLGRYASRLLDHRR